ncbi:MAG: Gfo/Idh/MocA family oxidoreductase [Phycisphaeraceae bacterium]|nr:Gfo/Idh/MocA family oxidoreductase [Phycisphaeraceae bacterium]
MHDLNRRDFVKTTAALLGAAAIPTLPSLANANPTAGAKELRVLQIGVGGIGGMDRNAINRHPKAKIVGLCDVDTNPLEKVGKQFPDAFRETDYRKVFADRLDEFDAVNVCTPDHTHIAPMLLALANDKHCYGQKPLVQQLEELKMLEDAVAAKPHLATNTGNQRMQNANRRIAVDILERGLLGKAIAGYCWTSTRRGSAKELELPGAKQPPANIDWDLWLGPADKQPYRDGIAPNKWRSWWDFGTAGLGDWGVHLLDIIMYSYPELASPVAVKCETPRKADWYHCTECKSTITYAVKGDKFKNDTFPIYYNDAGKGFDLRSIGIPKDSAGANNTVVQCEGGTLFIDAGGGKFEIYRDNKLVSPKGLGANTDVGNYAHWGSWVDKALGDKGVKVWTPFEAGLRMTECAILPVKASRFAGQELKWDKKTLTFTNSQEATDTVVRRTYRDGFAPPKVEA